MPRADATVVFLVLTLAAVGARAEGDPLAAACEAARARAAFASVIVEARPAPESTPTNKTVAACFRVDRAAPWKLRVRLPKPGFANVELTVARPAGLAPSVLSGVVDADHPAEQILTGLINAMVTRDDVFIDKSAESAARCARLKAAQTSVSSVVADEYVPADAGQNAGSAGTAAVLAGLRSCVDVAEVLPGGSLEELAERRGPFLLRGAVKVTRRPQSEGSVLSSSRMSAFDVVVALELVEIPGERVLGTSTRKIALMGGAPDAAFASDAFQRLIPEVVGELTQAAVAALDARAAAEAAKPKGKKKKGGQ